MMNTIFSKLSFLFLFSFTSTFASVSTVKGSKCIGNDPLEIGQSISNFKNHKNIDDNMEPDLSFLGADVQFVNMIRSAHQNLSSDKDKSRDLVEYRLRPSFVEKSYLYPHFTLLCRHKYESERFALKCEMINQLKLKDGGIKKFKSFAVKDFDLFIEAQSHSKGCRAGKTLLSYQITVETKSSEVSKIKNEIAGGSIFLKGIINQIFVEETFFKNYYTKFISEWLKTL